MLIFILRGKFSPDHMMTALRIFLLVYLMSVSFFFFLEIELTTQINFIDLTFVRDNIFPSFKKFLSLTMKILEKLLAVLSSSTCRNISKLNGKNEKDLLLVDYSCIHNFVFNSTLFLI